MANIEVVVPYLTFLLGIVLGALAAGVWFLRQSGLAEARASAAETKVRELTQFGTAEARVAAVVAPLKDTIDRLQTQVRDLEKGRERVFGSLESQISTLSRETVALNQTLRSPGARGRWGELTLRRVVELAGMAAHCDFYEQETVNSRQRPDLLVRLPGGRVIAVDAKAPLTAFQDAVTAPDDTSRKAALMRHSQTVQRHVDQLASRQYWSQIQPAPELVILFLPGDHLLSAALEHNPSLLESAIAQRVILATPSTLVSALAGVAHGWREQHVIENAELIRRTAGELCERLEVWQTYYAEMGAGLGRALEAYNRSVASWESRLVPSLRRIREMGVGTGSDPAAPEAINMTPREPKVVEVRRTR